MIKNKEELIGTEMRHHVMFETGISVPYPWHTMFSIMPDEHIYDSTCRIWRLKEKLVKRNRCFNRMLKWIILPLFIPSSFILLSFLQLIIVGIIPELATMLGIFYGILIFIGANYLNDVIGDLKIITNYYYKHRKFKN